MRVFKRPNLSNGWKCPICKTSEEKEVVLIGESGTEDGYFIEMEQYHLSCIELKSFKRIDDSGKERIIISQRIK